MRLAHRHRNGHRQASLPRAAKRAIADDLRRQLHVRVRQHDHMVLRSALALHPLPARRCPRIDVLRHRRRAHKADRAHQRVIAQRVHRLAPSVHQIDHALRQACFLDQFHRPPHGQWHALRRLHHKRVPTRDRVRQEPIRNHRRKIEGHDRRNHTERLADQRLVHSRRNVFQVVPLHQYGCSAGNLYVLDGAP